VSNNLQIYNFTQNWISHKKGGEMDLSKILSQYQIEDEKLVRALNGYVEDKLSELEDKLSNTVPKKVFEKKVAQYHAEQEKNAEIEADFKQLQEKYDGIDIKKFEAQNQELQSKIINIRKSEWEKARDKMKDEKIAEKFDKIKEDFIFAEEDKELELEDIEKNLSNFNRYDKINYFDTETEQKEIKTVDSTRPKTQTTANYYDPFATKE